MLQVFHDILSAEEIQILLDYSNLDDDRTDSRPDVRSKHPRWDIDCWPQDLVKKILDRILDQEYLVDDILFLENRMLGQGHRLHVDSGDNQDNLYKAVLIPLFVDGVSATVFFRNHWFGPSTRFSRVPISPFTYPIHAKKGIVVVNDIRDLLTQCKTSPDLITEFDVNAKFIFDLENLVATRSGTGITGVDRRTSDYSGLTGYDDKIEFPLDIQTQYMPHIPIENLHGLTIDQIVHWQPGSVITFPRTQLHCATATHNRKIGISMFLSQR